MIAAGAPRRAAVRIDPVSGVREEAMFAKAGDDEIFCVLHMPSAPPRGGVVFCRPLFEDVLTLYRPEVHMARACAAQGYAALRFHYRGTGHSGGLPSAMTLDSMADDTRWAAGLLVEAGVAERTVAFCGARWGGVVAGVAAAVHPGAPLILWEPVVDGLTYLTRVLREQNMRALAQQVAVTLTLKKIQHELATTGCADVMGHPLYRPLYEDLITAPLRNVAAGSPRPVLLIHVSRGTTLKPKLTALADAFGAAGSRVEQALITGEDPAAWSMGFYVNCTDALVATTLRWLTTPAVAE